jgi:hypothetical protein
LESARTVQLPFSGQESGAIRVPGKVEI